MPIHDWTRVEAGIFHDFHHEWISEIKRALNRGVLPAEYYAMAEQIAGGLGPDVLTLQRPTNGIPARNTVDPSGSVALAMAPPKTRFHERADEDLYAAKANAVVIRHVSNHKVVAMIEIVSPGNKNTRHGFRSFVQKAIDMIRAGVHLLILDLFPPGPRDPEGVHPPIWKEFMEKELVLPADKPLTLVSYVGCPAPEAFIEPIAVGATLAEMPLFLEHDWYVLVPLAATYHAAWEAVPAFWRGVLE